MSRVKISEYAAKKLFTSGAYSGISIDSGTNFSKLILSGDKYVVKVDDGTKKRNKNGLVKLGLTEEEAKEQAVQYITKGYRSVLIEPMVEHDEKCEQYISCMLVREGVSVLYSKAGGNNVEEKDAHVVSRVINLEDFIAGNVPELEDIPQEVLELILSNMRLYNFSFVEINPFVLDNEGPIVCLDLAVEIDDAKLHLLPDWFDGHIQENSSASEIEKNIEVLNSRSTSTFSLVVFNQDAPVFTLLSGGGASLVVLDEFVDAGRQDIVGNYGEYSGAPSREEVAVYTGELLKLMFASKAKKKALLIAGGVANFTNIEITFAGILDTCSKYLEEFKQNDVSVYVRRGGPRQESGLKLLKDFFETHNISSQVSGPEVSLSEVVTEVMHFVK